MSTAAQAAGAAPSSFRWTVCALLFFATTINYMDRQVLGLLAPLLQSKIGWNEAQYGYIVAAFQAAYALGLLGMGGLIDRIGVKLGYAFAIAIWSLAAMSHALARTVMEFGAARFALGIGESGNFPAAIKAVAAWFPKRERAFATGIFNSGTNVGATVAPLAVPWIAVTWGWQFAFLFTGVFSAIWVAAWLRLYRQPPPAAPTPAAPTRSLAWSALLPHRQTWAFVLGKFLTDPIWWFFLFWLPKFLVTEHHVSLIGMGLPLVVIYNAATVGSIAGGWLPARFLQWGWPLPRARKTAMLICALAVVPIVAAATVTSLWAAVALVSLATAAHQGWSANLFTMASDLFPEAAVASVVGIGGFGGALGGMLIAIVTGWLLKLTGSYAPIFVLAGSAYLVALAVIHLLTPRFAPVGEAG